MKAITIVGPPNVGKSTLFNYLAGYPQAITHYSSGVTRDRIYCNCQWKGNPFTLIDSGGYVIVNNDLQMKICEQFLFAIEESTDIIFVTDICSGILYSKISKILQRSNKKVFLAINKIDKNHQYWCYEKDFRNYFVKITDLVFISTNTGQGINDLFNNIWSKNKVILLKKTNLPRITLVGRKNVGKSSLINTLLNKNQSIVCDLPGTTRDCIEVIYNYFHFQCILIDTAGLIKQPKPKEYLEYFSFLRTTKAIDNSDLCLLILDSKIGFKNQERQLFHLIKKKFKSIIILINKCDLLKNPSSLQKLKQIIKEKIYPLTDIPIYFTSKVSKQNLLKVFKQAITLIKKQNKKINTSYFNQIMLPILENKRSKARNINIKYCVPILKNGMNLFLFFSNNPKLIPRSYKRFLEKQIRSKFDLNGIPIQINFKKTINMYLC